MPRRARLKLANATLHIIQRGNNRSACFYAEQDYLFYLDQLERACRLYSIALHAYVLMTNHVHLLLTSPKPNGASLLMKYVGQRYVQYVNRAYRRSGTLWEGRFRSCVVGEEDYLLGCYRYIELNPVRATMVEHPAQYRWSSYACNAQGREDLRITPHALYGQLGGDQQARETAYRELFRYELAPGLVDEIRQATNGGFVLGSPLFAEQVAQTVARRVVRGQAGRPFARENAASSLDQFELGLDD